MGEHKLSKKTSDTPTTVIHSESGSSGNNHDRNNSNDKRNKSFHLPKLFTSNNTNSSVAEKSAVSPGTGQHGGHDFLGYLLSPKRSNPSSSSDDTTKEGTDSNSNNTSGHNTKPSSGSGFFNVNRSRSNSTSSRHSNTKIKNNNKSRHSSNDSGISKVENGKVTPVTSGPRETQIPPHSVPITTVLTHKEFDLKRLRDPNSHVHIVNRLQKQIENYQFGTEDDPIPANEDDLTLRTIKTSYNDAADETLKPVKPEQAKGQSLTRFIKKTMQVPLELNPVNLGRVLQSQNSDSSKHPKPDSHNVNEKPNNKMTDKEKEKTINNGFYVSIDKDSNLIFRDLKEKDQFQKLANKFGIVRGKKLGEGASGSVSIIKKNDSKTYAVKTFRLHVSGSKQNITRAGQLAFSRKVTKEYCIGAALHHFNIIDTYDMLQDSGLYLVCMEFAPYDFFNLVMSELFTKHEVYCYLKQLVRGVNFMHSQGIAHRDLKLDNCVVNSDGILKIIDFGSAVIFKNPNEDKLILARGVVGSDPYLAPELLIRDKYDPRAADVWSIGIIFYCMYLRRFPWRAPKENLESFRNFCSKPDSPDDINKGPNKLLIYLPHRSRNLIGRMLDLEPSRRIKTSEIIQDKWYRTIESCKYDSEDRLVKIPRNHIHHLVTEEQLLLLEKRRTEAKNKAKNITTPHMSELPSTSKSTSEGHKSYTFGKNSISEPEDINNTKEATIPRVVHENIEGANDKDNTNKRKISPLNT
ncbi:hypothetical protein TBLA_0F00820 [Henningerozyma blattae CBS 6284]|uniref:non-specific serine/threonine protein kinase n=1 Tax=Henningerozyma blattae (strain ATCC 34711 / CBS 6284 / DSM 70876 / NBRC 10599 / NRRL Y-10934 / UCD 77-7) TaxID=1071380 RepID=I2H5H4_HENB6|nr:hypothetical protein TBLA_0F00820 [Tetrapisispora blattae CBS 6284]CCH61626.1 hypothetical protein TBLA_0F00820 [Tetrapisispora blattae CBS 6284]